MLTLCVTLGGIVTTCQTSPVAGHGVLVSLDTTVLGIAVSSEAGVVVLEKTGDLDALFVPAKREI
jgi:serine acetyltransferase